MSIRHAAGRLAALAAGLVLAAAAQALEVQGHRGARGLAPENTLAAFERALALGVDVLEMDVGVTADGVVVVAHDPTLNPAIARDASGRWIGSRPAIRSLALAELQAYDVGRLDPSASYGRAFPEQEPRDGERIPTLAAVFQRVRALGSGVRFSIETKLSPLRPDETADPEAMVLALLGVIRHEGVADRVAIQSFDWRTLKLVQRLAPGVPTVYLTSTTGSAANVTADGAWIAGLLPRDFRNVPEMVKASGGAIWSPNVRNLTEADLSAAKALGLKVVLWTVNEPDDLDRLIRWGVDGIVSDRPDRLRTAMQRRGLPLPAPVTLR
jgi:glycerophosphoryl diester phosphodiesterase